VRRSGADTSRPGSARSASPSPRETARSTCGGTEQRTSERRRQRDPTRQIASSHRMLFTAGSTPTVARAAGSGKQHEVGPGRSVDGRRRLASWTLAIPPRPPPGRCVVAARAIPRSASAARRSRQAARKRLGLVVATPTCAGSHRTTLPGRRTHRRGTLMLVVETPQVRGTSRAHGGRQGKSVVGTVGGCCSPAAGYVAGPTGLPRDFERFAPPLRYSLARSRRSQATARVPWEARFGSMAT
jgi:hypothetical protein